MNSLTHIHSEAVALIMAGGEGKRLWPLSTPDHPKQLSDTLDPQTLLVRAFHRAQTLFPNEHIFVVTTQNLFNQVKALIDLPAANWIVQPGNGDTAMALSFAALYLESKYPERTAVMFYTDQVVKNLGDFKKTVRSAIQAAQVHDSIIVVGTPPSEASTELGYVELGAQLKGRSSVFEVAAFKEKPDVQTAVRYVESGNYVWNTGVYVWRTQVLLGEIKRVAPDVYQDLLELKLDIGSDRFGEQLTRWYQDASLPSFDKLIAEKLNDMLVILGKFNWRDVGNWDSFYQLGHKDPLGNVTVNPHHNRIDLLDTENCLVIAHQSRISLLGLKDVVVVQTQDSLLICRRDLAGKVKDLVD